MYKCKKCDKCFENRYSYIGHCSVHSRKIKIKETKLHICKFCNKKFEKGQQLGGHTIYCISNPKRKENLKTHKENCLRNNKLSDEHKQLLSKKMKIAHKEGRAWNIGKSRWNNKPSYPEVFFKKVIENEFINKTYISEFNVGIYSLDFAWVDIKKCIEIDGSQHKRFEKQIESDIRKDSFLISKGWEILRISWDDLYNNTKEKIKEAKAFIDL